MNSKPQYGSKGSLWYQRIRGSVTSVAAELIPLEETLILGLYPQFMLPSIHRCVLTLCLLICLKWSKVTERSSFNFMFCSTIGCWFSYSYWHWGQSDMWLYKNITKFTLDSYLITCSSQEYIPIKNIWIF